MVFVTAGLRIFKQRDTFRRFCVRSTVSQTPYCMPSRHGCRWEAFHAQPHAGLERDDDCQLMVGNPCRKVLDAKCSFSRERGLDTCEHAKCVSDVKLYCMFGLLRAVEL